MAQENQKGGQMTKTLLVTVIMLLLTAVIALLIFMLVKKDSGPIQSPAAPAAGGVLTYDSTVVLDDPETLQKLVDEMVRKAGEGTMTLEMQVARLNLQEAAWFLRPTAMGPRRTPLLPWQQRPIPFPRLMQHLSWAATW